MAEEEKLHPVAKHLIITIGLCVFLFPLAPSIYLVGLAVYYGVKIARNKRNRKIAELAALECQSRERELQRQSREHEMARRNAQQRRVDARASCELLYNLHEADIRDRFNREALDRYMQKYMSDEETAETVERRGEELQGLIEKHCEVKGIVDDPQSIDDLAQWFIDEKNRIELLPLDERMRASHLAHLNMRYAELSQEILEKVRP